VSGNGGRRVTRFDLREGPHSAAFVFEQGDSFDSAVLPDLRIDLVTVFP
jgi:hypothetical protein